MLSVRGRWTDSEVGRSEWYTRDHSLSFCLNFPLLFHGIFCDLSVRRSKECLLPRAAAESRANEAEAALKASKEMAESLREEAVRIQQESELQVSSLNEKIAEMERMVGQLHQSELEKDNETVTDLRMRLAESEKEVEKLRSEAEEMRNELRSKQETIDRMIEDLVTAEKLKEEAVTKLTEFEAMTQHRIASLEGEIKERTDSSNLETQRMVSVLEEQVSALTTSAELKEKENADLVEQRMRTEGRLQEVEAALETSVSQISSLQSEISRLQDTLAESRIEHQKSLTDIGQERGLLEVELAKTKDQLKSQLEELTVRQDEIHLLSAGAHLWNLSRPGENPELLSA